ncbi:hypothetical protein BIZ83_gp178 [Erwinia phage vB_EamM_ChrisDB]|uniref:hypothetical protein n=1 Tax=Erwinia phage vB_EamM_ChrisDB TaxID=1883371 RepID=UPI00081CA41E|nr:hypothetical protein BIZ83_gp178 [Erwinia phage vB_EamM_ChrisDB]ANZ48675.1 hypothetical protein CHRISDB_113 [Erwinia phage vB_EamM_ChrisDB]
MIRTTYLARFDLCDTFAELLTIPKIEKTLRWADTLGYEQCAREDIGIVKSKYIVIYGETGKPIRVVWVTEDEGKAFGQYVVYHYWHMKPEWIEAITKLAARGLRCKPADIRILDMRKDWDEQ